MGILEELTGMVEAQRKKNTQYTAYEADDSSASTSLEMEIFAHMKAAISYRSKR